MFIILIFIEKITSEEYNSDNLINSINSIGTSWKVRDFLNLL